MRIVYVMCLYMMYVVMVDACMLCVCMTCLRMMNMSLVCWYIPAWLYVLIVCMMYTYVYIACVHVRRLDMYAYDMNMRV